MFINEGYRKMQINGPARSKNSGTTEGRHGKEEMDRKEEPTIMLLRFLFRMRTIFMRPDSTMSCDLLAFVSLTSSAGRQCMQVSTVLHQRLVSGLQITHAFVLLTTLHGTK